MSYHLFQSWMSATSTQHSYIFLAPNSQLFATEDCFKPNGKYKEFVKPYRLRYLLILSLYSLLRGSLLTVRMPHFHPYITRDYLIRLHGLGLIKLALYDDGFLGILELPSVLRHLRSSINSVCCWDLSGWHLSGKTLQVVQPPNSNALEILSVPLDQVVQAWMDMLQDQPQAKTMIVESKYMDYSLLVASYFNGSLGLASYGPPDYFLHPSVLKRNHEWPGVLPRNIIHSIPVEKYLVNAINPEAHLVAGMTSTVLFLCELAKNGALPRFRLTLLISDKDIHNPFYEPGEALDFCDFMVKVYGFFVDLQIVFNGQVWPLLKATKPAETTGSQPPG